MIQKILDSKIGRIVLSVIWGLGLSALFRRACTGRSCIVYKSPNPNKIQGKVFKYDEKCYKYAPKKANCDKVEENNVQIE
jgi:hypothetical protein